MGNNALYWDTRMEYPKIDPVAEIVALLSRRPMSLAELSTATGVLPGHVGLFIMRARTMGYHITAEGAVNAMYRLELPTPVERAAGLAERFFDSGPIPLTPAGKEFMERLASCTCAGHPPWLDHHAIDCPLAAGCPNGYEL